MPKQTWIVAAILSALIIVGFAMLSVLEKTREVDALRKELEEARQKASAEAQERSALEVANT